MKRVLDYFDVVDVPNPPVDPECEYVAQQQFKKECDMNYIVQQAMRGIAPSFISEGNPIFGDFSEIPDIAQAFNIAKQAEEAFNELPAALRRELGNDPRNFAEITEEQLQRFKLTKADFEAAERERKVNEYLANRDIQDEGDRRKPRPQPPSQPDPKDVRASSKGRKPSKDEDE